MNTILSQVVSCVPVRGFLPNWRMDTSIPVGKRVRKAKASVTFPNIQIDDNVKHPIGLITKAGSVKCTVLKFNLRETVVARIFTDGSTYLERQQESFRLEDFIDPNPMPLSQSVVVSLNRLVATPQVEIDIIDEDITEFYFQLIQRGSPLILNLSLSILLSWERLKKIELDVSFDAIFKSFTIKNGKFAAELREDWYFIEGNSKEDFISFGSVAFDGRFLR